MFLHTTGKTFIPRKLHYGLMKDTSVRPEACLFVGIPEILKLDVFISTSYQIHFCCNHFQSSITNDALELHKRCCNNICPHLASAFWIMVDHQQEPGSPNIRMVLSKVSSSSKGRFFFLSPVAYSSFRLWVSCLNWKDNNVKKAGDKRKSVFPNVFSSGCQLGAAAGSSVGVCVTRTLRTVKDNPTSVCCAESLRHLVWNQISVRVNGIMEHRDDLRGAFSCCCFWEDVWRTHTVALNLFRFGVVSF